jgi:hypothetical protein
MVKQHRGLEKGKCKIEAKYRRSHTTESTSDSGIHATPLDVCDIEHLLRKRVGVGF